MSNISPAIDPLSQRAAIDALEAQRASYRRLARQAEAQHAPLSTGDVAQVAEFTDGATREVGELEKHADKVRALVVGASRNASDHELQELERRMSDMMRDARSAEMAIRNLTSQLEAWRDAFGRQLVELGITPGTSTDAHGSDPSDPNRRGYGAQRDAMPTPRILDRRG